MRLSALCALGLVACGDQAQPSPEENTSASAPHERSMVRQVFAGMASDGQTLVALVRQGAHMMIYACDDEQDAWFRVMAYASPFQDKNAEGAQVMLALDDEAVIGSVIFVDQEPRHFKLELQREDVLFRAEDRVGGEDVLGGWIRLADGTQRGMVRLGAMASTSRLPAAGALVPQAPMLGPAPFRPESLKAPTPARKRRFDIYAMGDSYGAGEAAPETPGDYDDRGVLRSGGRREVWDRSLTSQAEIREAQACHRSGVSGVRVAATLLAADYHTAVDVRARSFACSGAQTEHLVRCPYRGAIGDHYDKSSDFLPPQITRVRQAAGPGGVDAIFMSIGGNNMRFGQLISSCVMDQCGPSSQVERDFFDAVAQMPARYQEIAQALSGVAPSPGAIYLAQAPNPLVNASGQPCQEVDLFKFFGALKVSKESVAWLARSIIPVLNMTFAAAAQAHGWTLISEHLTLFRGHGYCSSQPWFVDNPTSLKLQGDWMTRALNDQSFIKDTCISPPETRANSGPISPATVAGGVVHPNRDGYAQGYAPGIAQAMRPRLEDHIRPSPVGHLRILEQTSLGDVLVGWEDLSSTETEYRITVLRDGQSAPQHTIVRRADQTFTVISVPSGQAASGLVRVEPCYVGPTNRQVCAPVREVSWSNTAPTIAPQQLTLSTSQRAAAHPCAVADPQCSAAQILLQWQASAQRGVVYYDVELTGSDDKVQRLATAQPSFVANAQLKRARVRACNLLGCSAPSAAIDGPACPASQEVHFITGQCVSVAQTGLPPRDLMCQGVMGDPGGVCAR